MTQKKSKPNSKSKQKSLKDKASSTKMLSRFFQVAFYLLGGWYYVAGVIFLFALLALRFNSGIFFDQAIMELINYPILSFVPLVLTFSGVLFLYAGLKIIMGSKRGFWTAVVVLISVPLLIVGMNTLINYLEFQSVADISSFVDYYFESGYFEFSELDLIFYLVFFGSFIILLLSYKKFTFPDKLISSRARTFLVILTVFGVVTSLLFGLFSYFSIIKTDYGFQEVQDELNFAVLQPEWLPDGVTYATFYYVDENEDYGNGSEIYFDKEGSNLFNGIADVDNKIISIKQYEYDENKGLQYYHDSYLDLISEDNNECSTQLLTLDSGGEEIFFSLCVTVENPDPDFARYSMLMMEKSGNVVLIESPSIYISKEVMIDIVSELN